MNKFYTQILFVCFAFSIIVGGGGCKKNKLSNDPTIDEIESYVIEKQDHRANHTKEEFISLLNALNDDKFIVTSINTMKGTFDSTKVVVGMRHDVDCHPFKALEMAELEKQYGFKSSYYILATANYYGKLNNGNINRYSAMDMVYKNLHELGHEIGIHNDLLTVMIDYGFDALEFNHDEIAFYKSLGIEITGSAAHGSTIACKTVCNNQIFSDFAKTKEVSWEGNTYEIGKYSLKEFGFSYEAYYIDFNKYFSEPGGEWNIEGGLNQVIKELKESVPGDRIQILTHPVWWFK